VGYDYAVLDMSFIFPTLDGVPDKGGHSAWSATYHVAG